MNSALLGPADVRRIARQFGVRPTKSLGQNFVIDANTVRRIVRAAALRPQEAVVEVGPGIGSLTLALLDESAAVVAVEVDPTLAQAVERVVAERLPDRASRLTVLVGDAVYVQDLPVRPDALVANLPYNVAVPVILTMLARFDSIRHGLVMVQAEVADRLVAPPGSRIYGAPSVKLAWYADAWRAGAISRNAFWPVPNVDSALVAFARRMPPADIDRERVFAVVDAAFAQRRKTLRAALTRLAGDAGVAETALRRAGVDPSARGESIDVEAYARIARALAA